MTLEEFKKKYGTDTAVLMLRELMERVPMSPYMQKAYLQLEADMKALLK